MSTERRPTFAADFPRTPALDRLVEAFERGDYATVRALGPGVAGSAEDAAVRQAAETLVDRTRPEPLALGLLALAGALLLAMSAYWVIHGHAPPGAGPVKPPVEHVR